ncbi:protein ALTERED PHOSPHATE STARVATION RESPONSE 1-like [Cryptomeria japonica]|uniref:protein ALTERED PHOSPHATE STARVATION RESPONSE 1-like n=1 Tax=Cryptomeria japonica TaxID=3369 RepID=UPI0027DA3873|nr:protein ALTERED PHOSPHATE STARVATION RESPONSE 1-like [Cryptomeria japonica]
MQVVDSISRRIHMLRDEELQPQVVELIQGFMRMWKVMLECHQRQNKIIAVAKSLGHVGASNVSDEMHLKATIHLEFELQNWHACFSNWVKAQRAYVQALNGWLLKCLHQEPKLTSDGLAPFSPHRVGAPPVFVICNDWSQAFNNIPESEVVKAIEKFATAVKQVWEHQDEEQRLKSKAEFLEKDLAGRAHLVEKMESRLHEPQSSSDKKLETDIGQASAGLTEQKNSIDSFRKQVVSCMAFGSYVKTKQIHVNAKPPPHMESLAAGTTND